MKQKRLFLMVGIPGAGKSTWINTHVNFDKVVSRDKIRFADLEDGDEYFKNEKAVWKEFVKQIQEALDNDETVFADATHVDEKSRMKLLNALNLDGAEVNCIYFNVPVKTCIERNNLRSGRSKVPAVAIYNFANRITNPKNDKFEYDNVIEVND